MPPVGFAGFLARGKTHKTFSFKGSGIRLSVVESQGFLHYWTSTTNFLPLQLKIFPGNVASDSFPALQKALES